MKKQGRPSKGKFLKPIMSKSRPGFYISKELFDHMGLTDGCQVKILLNEKNGTLSIRRSTLENYFEGSRTVSGALVYDPDILHLISDERIEMKKRNKTTWSGPVNLI